MKVMVHVLRVKVWSLSCNIGPLSGPYCEIWTGVGARWLIGCLHNDNLFNHMILEVHLYVQMQSYLQCYTSSFTCVHADYWGPREQDIITLLTRQLTHEVLYLTSLYCIYIPAGHSILRWDP